jgi:hypothetical protein
MCATSSRTSGRSDTSVVFVRHVRAVAAQPCLKKDLSLDPRRWCATSGATPSLVRTFPQPRAFLLLLIFQRCMLCSTHISVPPHCDLRPIVVARATGHAHAGALYSAPHWAQYNYVVEGWESQPAICQEASAKQNQRAEPAWHRAAGFRTGVVRLLHLWIPHGSNSTEPTDAFCYAIIPRRASCGLPRPIQAHDLLRHQGRHAQSVAPLRSGRSANQHRRIGPLGWSQQFQRRSLAPSRCNGRNKCLHPRCARGYSTAAVPSRFAQRMPCARLAARWRAYVPKNRDLTCIRNFASGGKPFCENGRKGNSVCSPSLRLTVGRYISTKTI